MGFKSGNKGGSADLVGDVTLSTNTNSKTTIGNTLDNDQIKLVVNGTASVDALKILTMEGTSSTQNSVLVLDGANVVKVAQIDPRSWISSSLGGVRTLTSTTGSFTDSYIPVLTTSQDGVVDALANSIIRQKLTLNQDSHYVGIGVEPNEKLHIKATTAVDTPYFDGGGDSPDKNDFTISGTYTAGVEKNYTVIMNTLAYQHDMWMLTGGIDWVVSGAGDAGSIGHRLDYPAPYLVESGNLPAYGADAGILNVSGASGVNILNDQTPQDTVYKLKIVHTSTIDEINYIAGTGYNDITTNSTWQDPTTNFRDKVAPTVGEDRFWKITITEATTSAWTAVNTPHAHKGVDHAEDQAMITYNPWQIRKDTTFRIKIDTQGTISGSVDKSVTPGSGDVVGNGFDPLGTNIYTGTGSARYRIKISDDTGEVGAVNEITRNGTTTLSSPDANSTNRYTGGTEITYKIQIQQSLTSSAYSTDPISSGDQILFDGPLSQREDLEISDSLPSGITEDHNYEFEVHKNGVDDTGNISAATQLLGSGLSDMTPAGSYTGLQDRNIQVKVTEKGKITATNNAGGGASNSQMVSDRANQDPTSYSGMPNGYIVYKVEIDGTGTPDTFKWMSGSGVDRANAVSNLGSAEQSGVSITGTGQDLGNDGVRVNFDQTTGHTVGNFWFIDIERDKFQFRSRLTGSGDTDYWNGAQGAYNGSDLPMKPSTSPTSIESGTTVHFNNTRQHTVNDVFEFTASVDRFKHRDKSESAGAFGAYSTNYTGSNGAIPGLFTLPNSISVNMKDMADHTTGNKWKFDALVDRYKYSINNGVSWFSENIPITGAVTNTMQYDVRITLDQPIGAQVGDEWEIPVTADRFKRQAFNFGGFATSHDGGLDIEETVITSSSPYTTVVSGVTVQFNRIHGHTLNDTWHTDISLDKFKWQAQDSDSIGAWNYSGAPSSSNGTIIDCNIETPMVVGITASFDKFYGHNLGAYWQFVAGVDQVNYLSKDYAGNTEYNLSTPMTGADIGVTPLRDGITLSINDPYGHKIDQSWDFTASVDRFQYATSSDYGVTWPPYTGSTDGAPGYSITPGVAQQVPSFPGRNDISITFVSSSGHTLNDVFAFTAAVDRFRWKSESSGTMDDEVAYYDTPFSIPEIEISLGDQLLDFGLYGKFGGSTGHGQNDTWTFSASIAQPILAVDESGNKVFKVRNDGATRIYYNDQKFASFEVGDTGNLKIRATSSVDPQPVAIAAPNQAPVQEQMISGSVSFYIDTATHKLMVKVMYPDGTFKQGEVCSLT